jgi:hypothetical protein
VSSLEEEDLPLLKEDDLLLLKENLLLLLLEEREDGSFDLNLKRF